MHPNDTLNGKLIAWERPDEQHLRGKLGYWRMVEERMIRAEIEAEGGNPDDRFEIERRVTKNHTNDETYAQTSARRLSARALAQQAAFLRDAAEGTLRDRALEALRLIADGHNDARGLARSALEGREYEP